MAPKFGEKNTDSPVIAAEPINKKFQKNQAFELKKKRSMSVGELEKRSKPRSCSLADGYDANRRSLGSEAALETVDKQGGRVRKTSTYARFLHFCRKFKFSLTGTNTNSKS